MCQQQGNEVNSDIVSHMLLCAGGSENGSDGLRWLKACRRPGLPTFCLLLVSRHILLKNPLHITLGKQPPHSKQPRRHEISSWLSSQGRALRLVDQTGQAPRSLHLIAHSARLRTHYGARVYGAIGTLGCWSNLPTPASSESCSEYTTHSEVHDPYATQPNDFQSCPVWPPQIHASHSLVNTEGKQ
jgi:hypothetical protein